MFSKPELQIMGKTLMQRREWLIKNLDNPEMSNAKPQNQQTIQLLDGILSKLSKQLQNATESNETRENANSVNHYISEKTVSPTRQAAQIRRQKLMPDQIKVLVVDDDTLLVEVLTAILNSAGIDKVEIANDGMKAVTLMFDANPVYDLVLCDWHMPEKNGIDVHTAMRASERYHNTIFMLVTAVTEAKQIRDAIDEGVDDYVVKPLEQDKMLKKIARHFPQVKATS
jgi:two-component system, chemotaxis family, chemotaxis protein CheY